MLARVFLLSILGCLCTCMMAATDWPEPPAAVDSLVAEALKSHLVLIDQGLEVDRATLQLQQARSLFMPRVDLAARYSVASGGRTIDLPVGDLLNGAYSSLNQLLAAQGQAPRFGSVPNQSIPFLLPHEQQSAVRLTQPLYHPEIARGVEAARANQSARKAQFSAYRRALRADVEEAYFKWQQARAAVLIYRSALDLVRESLRVNQSLQAHGSGTDDAVLRAQAEVAEVQGQLQDAVRDQEVAGNYVNFLLNEPLSAPIPELSDEQTLAYEASLLSQPDGDFKTSGREEIEALDYARSAAIQAERAAKSKQGPSLGLALEGGIQGATYATGGNNSYALGSLVLDWNLFDGAQRRSEVAQAKLDTRRSEDRLAQTRNELNLQVSQARSEFIAAKASLRAASEQVSFARSNFASVSKKEAQGSANSLLVLDARNTLTRSELARVAAQSRLFIAAARLDQAATLSPLP